MPTDAESKSVSKELHDLDALARVVDLIELNAQAVRASVGVVEQAVAADMSRPTPCIGWTLYGLLAHMTTQHYGFAAASKGEGGLAQWKLRTLGADPVENYRTSAEHVIAAFAEVGVVDRAFPLPEFSTNVQFSAAQAVSFHFIDYVVHSWDVAKTLNVEVEVEFEPDVLDVALTVAEAAPGGNARLAPGAAFGPEISWSAGGRLDEIVAILGRHPTWAP